MRQEEKRNFPELRSPELKYSMLGDLFIRKIQERSGVILGTLHFKPGIEMFCLSITKLNSNLPFRLTYIPVN